MKIKLMLSRVKQQNAFTMIEVLAAMMLFGLIAAGIAPAFIDFTKHNTAVDLRTEALAAAQQKLDELRFDNPQSMPTSGTTGPETYVVNSRTFEINTTYCENAAFCPTNNTRHIKVEVLYNDQELVQVETVYTALR